MVLAGIPLLTAATGRLDTELAVFAAGRKGFTTPLGGYAVSPLIGVESQIYRCRYADDDST